MLLGRGSIWELEKGRTDNPAMALVSRLADHFAVSVSYLVNEDLDAPEADDDLRRMFRQAHELDERDLEALDSLLQTFLRRASGS